MVTIRYTIDNNPANSGTFKLDNIYKNEGTGYTFTQVNGGNTLIISKDNDPNRVIINNWSEANNLSISLTGSAPATTQATLMCGFKSIKSHFKTLNKQAYSPISMRVAGLSQFNLHAHKRAANDAAYNNTNERRAA